MVKAIIFDFFGVIVTEGLRPFIDAYFDDKPDKKVRAIKLTDDRAKGVKNIDYDYFLEALARLAGTTKTVTRDYLSRRRPNKPLLELIKTDLKPYYKIGLLSNASDDWVKKLLTPEEGVLFDEILLSYKQNMIKPDPRFYKLIAQKLGVEPSECLFIDDIQKYCDGAEAIGMKSILYNDFEDFRTKLQMLLKNSSNI
jgi:epoxide hydrolase-like predicted phosphatase